MSGMKIAERTVSWRRRWSVCCWSTNWQPERILGEVVLGVPDVPELFAHGVGEHGVGRERVQIGKAIEEILELVDEVVDLAAGVEDGLLGDFARGVVHMQ